MQDAQQDGAVTIAEAAAALGVSSDTIRRRIRRGELLARQVPTPNGPAWRVVLGVLPRVDSAPSAAPGSTPSAVPTVDGALGSAPSSTLGSAAGQESAALLRA